MFKAIVLFCAVSVPQGDCRPETAKSRLVLPIDSLQGCMLAPQSMLADAGGLPSGEYVKVICSIGQREASAR